MVQLAKPHDAASWTVATYLPFLWRPETHMFLKPEVTKDFAERVGHGLSMPTGRRSTSQCMTTCWTSPREQAGDRRPAAARPYRHPDFIWVVGDYTEADVPK